MDGRPERVLLLKASKLAPDNYQVVPPMGLLYLASVLRRAGHEVRIVDTRLGRWGEGEVAREVARFTPTICGISAISFESASLKRLARWVREASPGVRVVCGGAHPTVMPEDCLSEPSLDVAVIGEAEETFPEVVGALAGRRTLDSVKGIAFLRDANLVRTDPRAPPEDLDALPFPAWDLIDLDAYWRRSNMSGMSGRRYATMVTSRGCPYRCGYCHNIHGKKYRKRSPGNVLEEIRKLVAEYGVREIEFLDDNFNLDAGRAETILTRIAEARLGLNLSFPNGLRADRLTRYLVRLLRRAGIHYAFLAVETASPRIQKAMGRNLDLAKTSQAIRWCVEEGIFTGGFFMLGFPGETREEMEATVDFAVRSPLHQAHFFRVIPFRGTTIGASFNDGVDFSEQNYFDSTLNVSAVPSRALEKMAERAYARFYLDPARVIRILAAYPQRRRLPILGVLVARRMVKSVWDPIGKWFRAR